VRLQVDRSELAELGAALRYVIRELFLGPEPSEVTYRRCPECSGIRPLGPQHIKTIVVRGVDCSPPVEYRCASCRKWSPRVQGDEIA
jgi:DNA-directed RNA polymerase subunit RPC12/RpoP